jgi:hypothetical protein
MLTGMSCRNRDLTDAGLAGAADLRSRSNVLLW